MVGRGVARRRRGVSGRRHPLAALSQRQIPVPHWIWSSVGLSVSLDDVEKRKISYPAGVRSPDLSARRPVTMPTALSQLRYLRTRGHNAIEGITMKPAMNQSIHYPLYMHLYVLLTNGNNFVTAKGIRVVSLSLFINMVCYMRGCVIHHLIHIYSHTDDLVILNHRLCFRLKLSFCTSLQRNIIVFCVRHSFAFVKIAIRADG